MDLGDRKTLMKKGTSENLILADWRQYNLLCHGQIFPVCEVKLEEEWYTFSNLLTFTKRSTPVDVSPAHCQIQGYEYAQIIINKRRCIDGIKPPFK